MARSYLFIPGNEPRMLQNAEVFEADAIILDLEDAIHIDEKDEARTLVAAFLKDHPRENTPMYVRINAEHRLMKKDLEALKNLSFAGIVLPKTSPKMLARYENDAPISILRKELLALIESPEAFCELHSIAQYDSVCGFILGAVDLTGALGARRTPSGEEILYARSMLKMTAAAHGLTTIDTPWATMDEDALHTDIQKAVIMGFDGKCAIHPNQIPAINRAFTPPKAAVLEAKRIVKQHEKTKSMRFALDGRMIDKPVVDQAKATLEKARLYRREEEDA